MTARGWSVVAWLTGAGFVAVLGFAGWVEGLA